MSEVARKIEEYSPDEQMVWTEAFAVESELLNSPAPSEKIKEIRTKMGDFDEVKPLITQLILARIVEKHKLTVVTDSLVDRISIAADYILTDFHPPEDEAA